MDIRRKTVKATLRDEEIKKLQEQVLQLHRDKTALMSKCKTLSRGLACSFCNFRAECIYVDHSKDGDICV